MFLETPPTYKELIKSHHWCYVLSKGKVEKEKVREYTGAESQGPLFEGECHLTWKIGENLTSVRSLRIPPLSSIPGGEGHSHLFLYG